MEIRNHKKATRPFNSKIHLNGNVYTYKIGVTTIVIKTPDLMKTYMIGLNEFTGDPLAESKSSLAHERSQWKCLCEFGSEWKPIIPSQVKAWISENIK